jgi:hypothetical protein
MYKTPHVRTSTVVIGHTRTALFNTFDVGVVGRCGGGGGARGAPPPPPRVPFAMLPCRVLTLVSLCTAS